jgi:hypothetical protein
MGFIFRRFMKTIMSGVSGNASKIVTILFSAFKGMPIRVGLAILGAIIITISFLGGLFLPSLERNLGLLVDVAPEEKNSEEQTSNDEN